MTQDPRERADQAKAAYEAAWAVYEEARAALKDAERALELADQQVWETHALEDIPF